MLALLAPGQGAQTPGMLRPWLDLPDAADRLRWWSAVTGVDLVTAGTTAGAQEIRDTAIAQPLIVATGLLAAAELGLGDHAAVSVLAGHSVGEMTAAVLSGVLSAETALVLVAARGRLMAEAAADPPTGMSAVLGGDEDEVVARIESLGLTAANRNGAGQVVAAGAVADLHQLAAAPPPGARVRPLPVAGAFHTRYMAPARHGLDDVAAGVAARDPRTRLLTNADGSVLTDAAQVVRHLVDQVASPVRWDRCMATMRDLGVTAAVELPPAGTLTGLVKRSLPGVPTLALRNPDDLPAARAMIAEQVQPEHEPAPAWRVAVAPVAGVVRLDPIAVGEQLDPGSTLGVVRSRTLDRQVTAAYGGTLVEWLVADGDPVSPGQPVARIHPEATLP